MTVATLSAYRYRLPLNRPLQLGAQAVAVREGFLLRLTLEGGAVGWGEAAPLPGFSREQPEAVAAALTALCHDLPGLPVDAPAPALDGAVQRRLDAMPLAPSVRFGLETALWQAYAQHHGVTLADLLARAPLPSVAVNALLMGTAAEQLRQARQLKRKGYTTFKAKVGRLGVEAEVALVRQIAAAVAPAALRLDANRAWTLDEARAFMSGLNGTPIAYLEEPLADPAALPLLAEAGVPVALDESMVGLPVAALERHRYARAVILKPTLLGGLAHCLRLARQASVLGLTPVVSAAFESGVGTAALVALAAACGPAAAGLDPYRWLAADVYAPRLPVETPSIDVAALLLPSRPLRTNQLERLA